MPQLMPFYWVNSVFMILYILITLIFFYYYKNIEGMCDVKKESESFNKCEYLW